MRASLIPEKFYCELDLSFDEYVSLLTRLKKLTKQLHTRSRANASCRTGRAYLTFSG